MNYDEVVKLAFLDELRNIASVTGQSLLEVEKLAEDERFRELLKEAAFLQAVRKLIPQSGTAKFMQSAAKEGLGDVAKGALKASKPSARLQQWGQAMRQTPVQRVRAAAQAATNPAEKALLKMRPGDVRGITEATQRMGGTSLGKRMVGAAAEGAGAHTGHAGLLKSVGAHVGVPMGGAFEGVIGQAGRELKSGGTNLRAAGARTRAGGGGALQRAAGQAASGVGTAAQKAAPVVGQGLEAGAMLATGIPALTSAAPAVIPGVAAAAKGAGTAGLVAKKMLGGHMLGAADKGLKHMAQRFIPGMAAAGAH